MKLNNELKHEKLLLFTRLIKNVNFYVQFYKICDNRFREKFNFLIRFVLKQNKFNRIEKNIHNKFIFNEIVAFIILLKNLNQNYVLKQNFII